MIKENARMRGGQRLACGILAAICLLSQLLPFAAIHLPLVEIPIVGFSAITLSRYISGWIGLCGWLAALVLIGALLGNRWIALSGTGLSLIFSLVFAISHPRMVTSRNVRFLIDSVGALGQWLIKQAGLETESFSPESLDSYARLITSQLRLGIGYWLFTIGSLANALIAHRNRNKKTACTTREQVVLVQVKRPGSSPF